MPFLDAASLLAQIDAEPLIALAARKPLWSWANVKKPRKPGPKAPATVPGGLFVVIPTKRPEVVRALAARKQPEAVETVDWMTLPWGTKSD